MPCPSHKSDITMKKINSSPLSISVLLFASLTGLDKERERERGGVGGCVCVKDGVCESWVKESV